MADADWAKYKQLRGKTLPEAIHFRGATYRLEQLFKRDFYAATGLYGIQEAEPAPDRLGRIVLKIYHTEPLGIIPLGWLGRLLCNREVFYYQAVDGISGLGRLLARHGETGYIREYIPGCHLREFRKSQQPDDRFYPVLKAMLGAIHSRGISHNDLSKPENILVRPDGTPSLIDFQIASRFQFRFPILKQLGRRVLQYMQSVDRYHLEKHHRRDRKSDFTPEESRRAKKKGILLVLHGWLLRRPYRIVRHFILRRFMRVGEAPVIPVEISATGTRSSRSKMERPPAKAD